MKIMDFMDGKTEDSMNFSIKIGELFESITHNIFMVVFLLVAVAVAAIVITPILLGSENAALRGVGALTHVIIGVTNGCHQLPYRTFIIDGIPQPICSRDIGIYVGLVLGFATILYSKTPKILREKKSLLIAFTPIILDGASQTILHLRESNDLIRFATGFIFTFFLIGFLTQRFFSSRYPGFRERVLDKKFLTADLLIVAAICYAILPFTYDFGLIYMSRNEAVNTALANSPIKTPFEVKSYFIAPQAPISLKFDPFYSNHKDIILKDLYEMPWYNVTQCYNISGCSVKPIKLPAEVVENESLTELLRFTAENEHNLGLWVVAVLEEKPSPVSDPYMQAGKGEYYYFDAYTHRLIAKENH